MAITNAVNANQAGIQGVTSGGVWNGTAVTNHAVIVGGSTPSTLSSVGPTATAGQVLQSAGSSSDPTFSTATYPSTAGTSGNVLTSDGTNWVSSTPSGSSVLLLAEGTLTNAQIKALHTTPVEIVAASGSNKVIILNSACLVLRYGGSDAFTGSGNVTVYRNGSTTSVSGAILNSGSINSSSDRIGLITYTGTTGAAFTAYNNVNLTLFNSATAIGGNASNDNTMSYSVSYYISTIA